MRPLTLRSLWRKLERLLSEALEIERGRIDARQADAVQEFLDHNELGLAYDTLVDALAEHDLAPVEESKLLLEEAFRLMQPDR